MENSGRPTLHIKLIAMYHFPGPCPTCVCFKRLDSPSSSPDRNWRLKEKIKRSPKKTSLAAICLKPISSTGEALVWCGKFTISGCVAKHMYMSHTHRLCVRAQASLKDMQNASVQSPISLTSKLRGTHLEAQGAVGVLVGAHQREVAHLLRT